MPLKNIGINWLLRHFKLIKGYQYIFLYNLERSFGEFAEYINYFLKVF